MHCGICGHPEPLTYLIKGDLLIVPVLNVEEQNHTAIFVPAVQDARVAGLDGTAYGLWGQILEQLRVILPETHVALVGTQEQILGSHQTVNLPFLVSVITGHVIHCQNDRGPSGNYGTQWRV